MIIVVLALYAFVALSPIFSDFRRQYLYGKKSAAIDEVLPHEPGYLEQQWAEEYRKDKKPPIAKNDNSNANKIQQKLGSRHKEALKDSYGDADL
jgi:hypothetical protein